MIAELGVELVGGLVGGIGWRIPMKKFDGVEHLQKSKDEWFGIGTFSSFVGFHYTKRRSKKPPKIL
jgi:hypothetical protein